jgi:hypothetical protein
MSRTWLSWRNWVDAPDAVPTAASEAGELIATNLKRRQASSVWRTLVSSGGSTATVTFDFARVREVGALALVFPRTNDPGVFDLAPAIGSADTIRHRLSAVSATGSELLDTGALASGVDAGYGYHVYRLASPVNTRWWRVDISAPSRVAEGFVDVARAWAGPVFEPATNFSYGDNASWVAATDVARARRGLSDYAESAEATQAWSLSFDGVKDHEREMFDDFERLMTTGAQFLIVRPDRPVGRQAMLARQTQSSGLDSSSWRRNRKQLRLTESL